MNQTRKKNSETDLVSALDSGVPVPDTNTKRSEEITEIVDRMPMAFGRWIAIAVVIFASLLLFFGWVIKYPDTVTGNIKINSTNSPVKLVANVSGNIHLGSFHAQDEIKKNEYIAVLENPAITEDVQKIRKLIGQFAPYAQITDPIQQMFPEKVSLGDLNMKYYTFLSALKNQYDYNKDNVYEKQRIALQDKMNGEQSILRESEQLLLLTHEKLKISQKWLDKYTSLNKDEIVTYEYELDRIRNDYLSAKQEDQNLQKDMSAIRMQIIEDQNQINRLDVEQKEMERTLRMELLSSYQDLCDNIKTWEQRYVFKAPFDGKVEYLKFLTENQFVQTGEEIFGIVPKETNI